MEPTADRDLRALSEHLQYEVQMLFALADRLRAHASQTALLPDDLQMATVESFAVHARVLIEFLWTDRKPKDRDKYPLDAFAEDYFAAGAWKAVRPAMETTLKRVASRTGAEVAHLSYRRTLVGPEERGWDFDLIAGSIGRAIRVFVEHADHHDLVEHFEATVRATWPKYLNYPAAVSLPPTSGALSAATAALSPRRSIHADEASGSRS